MTTAKVWALFCFPLTPHKHRFHGLTSGFTRLSMRPNRPRQIEFVMALLVRMPNFIKNPIM